MNEVEVKRKLYEEYVQHINKIKLEHQAQLEKGNIFLIQHLYSYEHFQLNKSIKRN
jgi:hypothetical protein